MEELGVEPGVEVGLQKLSSCFTATISIAGASYCIFIAKIAINNQLRNSGRKCSGFFPFILILVWVNRFHTNNKAPFFGITEEIFIFAGYIYVCYEKVT